MSATQTCCVCLSQASLPQGTSLWQLGSLFTVDLDRGSLPLLCVLLVSKKSLALYGKVLYNSVEAIPKSFIQESP